MIPLRNYKRFFSKVFKQPGYAFKVAIKRTKAYLSYSLWSGKSGSPEAITLFLTHRCNLRCKMCGQWGEAGVTKEFDSDTIKEELSIDSLKKLIDDLGRKKTNITLFGGEPLLNSNCIELVRHIKSRDMHCLMITNGSLLTRYGHDLVDAGIDEINLSLDGGRELHDEIRGVPGMFDRIISGVKEVNRIKKEKGVSKPLINLQCTISQFNYEHLEQLLDVASEMEVNSLTFHNLIFLTRELIDKQREIDQKLNSSSKEWEGFVFEHGLDPEKLYEKIEEIKHSENSFDIDFYPNFSKEGLKEYYNNPNYLPSEYSGRCVSPWIAAYVFPDGEVRPCLNSSFSYGNITKERFINIWNSKRAVEFRTSLKKDKIFPACIRCTELYRY